MIIVHKVMIVEKHTGQASNDIKVRSQKKKRYYLGIFPKRRTPPFWEPLIQKKILVFILHFRT